MLRRTLASELPHHLDQRVLVRGWIHTLRALGKLAFLIVRDRSGLAQVVIEDKELFKQIAHLQPGSVLRIEARARSNPQAELGVELTDPSIEVEVPITQIPSIEYNKPTIPSDLDHILDHRAIALRNRSLAAVFKIQAEIVHAFRLFMHDTVQAVEYFAPNMIGASSEGGAEFFNVDYFGYTATLAQSSQLYKQIMVGVHERVFALMPFFRAEPSHTPRHLSEGKQFEFEMGFFDHWHTLLEIQEQCIKAIIEHLRLNCAEELELLGHPLIQAPAEVPFPRLSFAQAQQLYFERTGIDERHEPDLSPGAERELCNWALETHGTELVFVTDWKTVKRPFYSYPNPEQPELTNTFDLLCAGTEITSGGQRRHTYESMVEGIRAKGMDPDHFSDYLSIFAHGMPAHGGFGMGLERLTMTLLRLRNIRETSLFPSDPKRIASVRLKAKICYGAENIRCEITRLLKQHRVEFEPLESSSLPHQGVKSMILRGKSSKKNYLLCLPSQAKLDMKAVAELVGEKCELEAAEVIQERFGLSVTAVPPFGNLLNLETFFDSSLLELDLLHIQCGVPGESIALSSQELQELVTPKVGEFSKL